MKPPTRRDWKLCPRHAHNTYLSDYRLCTEAELVPAEIKSHSPSLFHAKRPSRIQQSASSMLLNEPNYVFKGGDTMVE